MAKQVFESMDLVRTIYSFGDPFHRTFTENLKVDLRPWPSVFMERYGERREGMCMYLSLDDYLNEYSTEKIIRLQRSCKRCYCCARHSIRKVHMRNMSSFLVMDQGVFENAPSECDCPCRLLNRVTSKHLKERDLYERQMEE